jgi:hypothetical protein
VAGSLPHDAVGILAEVSEEVSPFVVGHIDPSATYCLINDVVIVVRVDQIGITMGVSWDATTRPAAVS